MKKRQIIKNTKKKHYAILDELSKYFRIKNLSFGLLTIDKSESCSFKIKQLKDWSFGLYLNRDNTLTFFGEHNELKNKFNAGLAYLKVDVTDKQDVAKKIVPKLYDIMSNPKLHFICSLHCSFFGHPKEGLDIDKEYKSYFTKKKRRIMYQINKYQKILKQQNENNG